MPPIPGNQLTVDVQPQVAKDLNTGIYTYGYSVTNSVSSIQDMWFFAVTISPGMEIFNATSPPGWKFGVHETQPIASWASVESEAPPDYIDDGNVLPSPFDLNPGQTLSGFSFQTYAAPSDGIFCAQGFRKSRK